MSIFIRIVRILTILNFFDCKLTNNCNFMIVDGTTITILICGIYVAHGIEQYELLNLMLQL